MVEYVLKVTKEEVEALKLMMEGELEIGREQVQNCLCNDEPESLRYYDITLPCWT